MGYPPAVADFKSQFVRPFAYGVGPNAVQDADIQAALNMTQIVFNSSLWADDAQRTIAYNYAAAHFMVLNIQSAGGLMATNTGQGVKSHGGGVIESKGVGSVNVGYALPDYVRQDPILSQFMRTDFGQTYLQLLTPRLVGNIAVVSGTVPVDGGFGGNVSPITITTLSLPAPTHAVVYSQKILSTGGLEPLSWAVSSGSLPTGLSLNAVTGVLSGTPTTAATYYFAVTVTDGRSKTASMNYQMVVA